MIDGLSNRGRRIRSPIGPPRRGSPGRPSWGPQRARERSEGEDQRSRAALQNSPAKWAEDETVRVFVSFGPRRARRANVGRRGNRPVGRRWRYSRILTDPVTRISWHGLWFPPEPGHGRRTARARHVAHGAVGAAIGRTSLAAAAAAAAAADGAAVASKCGGRPPRRAVCRAVRYDGAGGAAGWCGVAEAGFVGPPGILEGVRLLALVLAVLSCHVQDTVPWRRQLTRAFAAAPTGR
eukprot:scaffold1116_cov340-Prasinococcus_capsulatus_cf.AAC.1